MNISFYNLPPFVKGYVSAALWLLDEHPPCGEYPESKLVESFEKLSDLTFLTMLHDCTLFQVENEEYLKHAGDESRNGHDFWLSRNGEGSGFFDRGYSDPITAALETSADEFGKVDLYFGDDGFIYSL